MSGKIQNVQDSELMNHFSKYGKIIKFFHKAVQSGVLERFAFVEYDNTDAVDKAMKDVHMFNNTLVDVRRSRVRSESCDIFKC